MTAGKDDDDLNDRLIDILQHSFFRHGFLLERWLINRRRRKEGRAPFPWFESRSQH